MGRPLYSLSYTTPAVRTEPEPGVSPYEKWTHWNPFDPDSDEFNEQAIFEDFIDRDQMAQTTQEDVDQVVDLVQQGEGSNSSSSSEGTVSEQGSPMAVGSDDPARMLAEAVANMYDAVSRAEMDGESTGDYRSRFRTLAVLPERTSLSRSARSTITPNAIETLPRTSDITPINIPVSRNRVASTRGPVEGLANSPGSPGIPSYIPSTPPSHSPFGRSLPSPGTSATPTFLTWTRHPMTPGSPTPNSNGPLTNPSARMSVAHIPPSLIRVQNVII